MFITFVMGIRQPEYTSAFMDTAQSFSFFRSKSACACSSRQNALTTLRPDMLSSICPLSMPRSRCRSLKSFFVRLVTTFVSSVISPTPAKAISVSSGLVSIIITKTPITVKQCISSCVSELDMVVLMLSTSFVRRLISSPC